MRPYRACAVDFATRRRIAAPYAEMLTPPGGITRRRGELRIDLTWLVPINDARLPTRESYGTFIQNA